MKKETNAETHKHIFTRKHSNSLQWYTQKLFDIVLYPHRQADPLKKVFFFILVLFLSPPFKLKRSLILHYSLHTFCAKKLYTETKMKSVWCFDTQQRNTWQQLNNTRWNVYFYFILFLFYSCVFVTAVHWSYCCVFVVVFRCMQLIWKMIGFTFCRATPLFLNGSKK